MTAVSPQLHLIFYTRSGCHLCASLAEKLAQIQTPKLVIEMRDITTREDWFQAYQYEVPVLCTYPQGEQGGEPVAIPRPSPRATVAQLQQLLQRYI